MQITQRQKLLLQTALKNQIQKIADNVLILFPEASILRENVVQIISEYEDILGKVIAETPIKPE